MALPVSIVVVSRGRPALLMRCLNGIAQLDFPSFEVIVVACPAGMAALAARADADHIKAVTFDEANISVARNLGIAQAAGEVVAFIDDDAVPEPLWLTHLTAPFESEPDLAASGGYVLGRNGISFQWTARSVDETGTATPLDVPDKRALVLHPTQDRAIKTEGTNMALRREVLAEMGGFDPVFRFFLDETDLNMRLAHAGLATALVPLAQVHHGFAASAQRRHDRTPSDLFEIGASQAAFLRKHCAKPARAPAWARFRAGQRDRLLRHMQRGPLGADDVLRLMRRLDAGHRDGMARAFGASPPLPRAAEGFRPYPGRPGAPRKTLAGRIWHARALRARAAQLVRDGAVVSLFLFGPSTRYHHVRFSQDGVWEQSGGRFGRSVRDAAFFSYWRFSRRVASETARVAPVRGSTPGEPG